VKLIYQSNFKENSKRFSKPEIHIWVEEFYAWLFCTKDEYMDYIEFKTIENQLKASLYKFILKEKESEQETQNIITQFYKSLSNIHHILMKDISSFLNFDPAAQSKDEIILCYPGFFAISVYRIAHELQQLNVSLFSRIISEYAHSKTGIDIHPKAEIGKNFLIDHGTGVVIGATSIIGNNVKIYQGVTLGALTVSKEKAKEKRHPTIQDNVIIYANATILGGNTIIGKDSIIGGNVWITDSIPENSMVFHKSEIVIKNKQKFPEALNFTI